MTHKRITFGVHVSGRISERRIRRADVRWLIARGTRTPAPTRPGAEQRWESRGYIGHREASVIYIERATEIVLVTVQWLGEASDKEQQT